jgi:sialic acid synthase SpsE
MKKSRVYINTDFYSYWLFFLAIFRKNFTKNFYLKLSFFLKTNNILLTSQGRVALYLIAKLLVSKNKKILPSERKPLQKMYKSIVASRNLKIGTVLKYSDISFKSPGGGLKPYEYKKILNKKNKIEIKKDQLILIKNLK